MSHSIWVRGLKHAYFCELVSECKVALYMGAWIETLDKISPLYTYCVALYMGAWIETKNFTPAELQQYVALYMGAWIETKCPGWKPT